MSKSIKEHAAEVAALSIPFGEKLKFGGEASGADKFKTQVKRRFAQTCVTTKVPTDPANPDTFSFEELDFPLNVLMENEARAAYFKVTTNITRLHGENVENFKIRSDLHKNNQASSRIINTGLTTAKDQVLAYVKSITTDSWYSELSKKIETFNRTSNYSVNLYQLAQMMFDVRGSNFDQCSKALNNKYLYDTESFFGLDNIRRV